MIKSIFLPIKYWMREIYTSVKEKSTVHDNTSFEYSWDECGDISK